MLFHFHSFRCVLLPGQIFSSKRKYCHVHKLIDILSTSIYIKLSKLFKQITQKTREQETWTLVDKFSFPNFFVLGFIIDLTIHILSYHHGSSKVRQICCTSNLWVWAYDLGGPLWLLWEGLDRVRKWDPPDQEVESCAKLSKPII